MPSFALKGKKPARLKIANWKIMTIFLTKNFSAHDFTQIFVISSKIKNSVILFSKFWHKNLDYVGIALSNIFENQKLFLPTQSFFSLAEYNFQHFWIKSRWSPERRRFKLSIVTVQAGRRHGCEKGTYKEATPL